MLRVFLFILMQAAVVALVGLVGSVILVALDIDVNAQSYGGLLLFCAVIGCAGSVISLFLSKSMCKTAYRVIRAFHGKDDDSPAEISDLTLEVFKP